jgi:hypothetical protein
LQTWPQKALTSVGWAAYLIPDPQFVHPKVTYVLV